MTWIIKKNLEDDKQNNFGIVVATCTPQWCLITQLNILSVYLNINT